MISPETEKFNKLVDLLIRLGFLFLILSWSFRILTPFTNVILWGIILAMALFPLHKKLSTKLKNNNKLASIIIVILSLTVILVPTYLLLNQTISSLSSLVNDFQSGILKIPKPSKEISEWPIIGENIYDIWQEFAENIEAFFSKHKEQFMAFGETFLEGVKNIGGSYITLILSVIISGALLSNTYTQDLGKRFFTRLLGKQGDEFIRIMSSTVGNVVKGVIGVAIIQSFLIGLGLFLFGVPYAGVWTLLALVMAILQLPVLPIIILVIVWLFDELNTFVAIIGSIYFIAAALSDTPMKALFLGKGASVPMLVIFLGVIGGFMSSGFIGLFTGAIIVSISYTLFINWLEAK
jgi:predicted PurR-regulated permease PerM